MKDPAESREANNRMPPRWVARIFSPLAPILKTIAKPFSCPTTAAPANAAASAETQAALLATAFSLSPAVETTAPGVCTLDLSGVSDAEREPVVRRALEQLAELGLHGTAGGE